MNNFFVSLEAMIIHRRHRMVRKKKGFLWIICFPWGLPPWAGHQGGQKQSFSSLNPHVLVYKVQEVRNPHFHLIFISCSFSSHAHFHRMNPHHARNLMWNIDIKESYRDTRRFLKCFLPGRFWKPKKRG